MKKRTLMDMLGKNFRAMPAWIFRTKIGVNSRCSIVYCVYIIMKTTLCAVFVSLRYKRKDCIFIYLPLTVIIEVFFHMCMLLF